jgi:hypothetical protein
MADMSWVRCVAFDECTRPPAPSGSAVAAGVTRAAGEVRPLRVRCRPRRLLRRHTVTMRPYGIEPARTLPSYEAADGCTAHEGPAPRGRTCKATANAKHSAL